MHRYANVVKGIIDELAVPFVFAPGVYADIAAAVLAEAGHAELLAVVKRVAAGGLSFPKYDRDLAVAAIAKAEGRSE